ncbi:MmcQ/YjbR family DNA-binding protein [bacterium]|nr:MmcQ/YjbR family DNA-binding protein [bacterium]
MAGFKKVEAELRKAALAYPGAYEEKPWGERVCKVKGKIFLFVGSYKGQLHVTAKLPESASVALMLPFAKPTAYGLGKSGWVTASFEPGSDPPVPLFHEWLDESYRAIAPRKLVAELDGAAPREEKKPPAKKARSGKKTKPVLLVGDDELRLERASVALEERGLSRPLVAPPTDEALARAQKKRPSAIVIDLGRRPDLGLELGSAIARSPLDGTPLLFAGARDAATVRRVKKQLPGSAACFREPPGDPRVIEKVASVIEAR